MKNTFVNLEIGAIFTYHGTRWKKTKLGKTGSSEHNAVRAEEGENVGTCHFADTTVVLVERPDHRFTGLGPPFFIRSKAR